MRRIAFAFLVSATLSAQVNAASPITPRVPPPGLAVPDTIRRELEAQAASLGRELVALRSALDMEPRWLDLLPDVEIFHKAVAWPLQYGEFYRTNELELARRLLAQGQERAQALRQRQAPWLTATGLVVRGFRSAIDGSVQP